MDAQTLSSVLSRPSLLRNYPMTDLQLLGQQHPYASMISALIAIKAHDENDSVYEYYLSQAAIRVPDRKRLYHLIHAQPDITVAVAEPMEPASAGEAAASREMPVPPIEEKTTVLEKPVAAPVPETGNQVIIKEEKPEILKQPEEESPVKLPGAEETAKALMSINEPERQMPAEPPEMKNQEQDAGEEEASLKLPGAEEAAEILKSINEAELQKAKLPEEGNKEREAVEEEAAGKKHSFTEWLSFIGQKKEVVKETPVQKEIKENAENVEYAFSKANELTENEEASIKRKAKESLSDDLEWVTETLAKIYELQKKYDKAEEAYKMLSLKYPDKKAYFAQRIENLKRFKV